MILKNETYGYPTVYYVYIEKLYNTCNTIVSASLDHYSDLYSYMSYIKYRIPPNRLKLKLLYIILIQWHL